MHGAVHEAERRAEAVGAEDPAADAHQAHHGEESALPDQVELAQLDHDENQDDDVAKHEEAQVTLNVGTCHRDEKK